MFRQKKIVHLIILLLAFYSCEYNLTKENFIELTPPSDTHLFDLNFTPEGDTINIFNKTEFKYSLNTNGLNIIRASFIWKGNTIDFSPEQGTFSIDPENYDSGLDSLKLAIYTNSQTGSIADITGQEGYYIEKKWIVISDGRPAPKLVASKRINEDGLLVIEWPKCEQFNFSSYEISGSSSNRMVNRTITDADHNFYVDSLYVGGDYSVRVSCVVEGDHTWGETLKFTEEPPQPNIEEIGMDSLKISWHKSAYNAKYRLMWNNNDVRYFDETKDTVCTIAQIGFGNFTKFRLSTKSQYYNAWPDASYACDITRLKEYYFGERLISANWPEFGYNPTDKVLYSNQYNQMKCFDTNNFATLYETAIDRLSYEGLYSCPTNSSKVATVTYSHIYIFDNKKLENPTIIDYGRVGAYSIDHFLLTDNDLLAFVRKKQYKIIDINSKQTIASIAINDYPVHSKWACISTAQNGKYMCVVSENGIKLYTIGNGLITESFTDSRNYRSAYFNPYNPNQLYLTLNDKRGIEVRDPSDFSLLNTIDTPSEMVIRNIDPETNNILITDYEKLFVINPQSQEVLIKVPCDESKSWLYNNRLLTNTGYVLNLSNKL